jgi:hypothetical protein
VAAHDLRFRLNDANDKISTNDSLLPDTVREIAAEGRKPREEFARWANDFGQYALSTVYMTVVYFARASRIRTELPFVELSAGDDEALLRHLEKVRLALGGDYGIWVSLQDSLGTYLTDKNGTVATYREFCEQLADPVNGPWYHRVVEFFRDLHMKTPTERNKMVAALDDLVQFLRDKPREARKGIEVSGIR